MASSANPDLWSDLSDLSGTDACAALLKVNAEMFAAAPARDRESIETFEALALGFLPKVSTPTLVEIARILHSCLDTPTSVLDYLRRHAPEAHGLTQRRTAAPQSDARLLATAAGRTNLASQPRLEAGTIDRILVLREEASEDALAANPALSPATAGFHRLVNRAVDRPALARILLQRQDLTGSLEARLYLAADRERRRRIRERIARNIVSSPVMTYSLSKQEVDALLASSADGDIGRFEALLTEYFGFSVSTEWRVLQIGRHILLPLALNALGVPSKDATRILVTLHPALIYPLSTIRELVREMRDTPRPVALALVETILGVKALTADNGTV